MLYSDAVTAFRATNYEKAKGLFLQAINEAPQKTACYYYLAKCYFFCNQKQLAIAPIEKFIDLMQKNKVTAAEIVVNPDVVNASISNQSCDIDTTDTPEHEECLDATEVLYVEAEIFYPLDDIANISYALDLLAQCSEETKDTLQRYDEAIKIYPGNSSAWHNKGLLYQKLAIASLEENLEDSIVSFNNAFSCIETALNINEDHPYFLHSKAGLFEAYVNVLKKTIDTDELSRQKQITEYFNNALTFYRKALSACQGIAVPREMFDNFVECLAQFGHHHYKNQDYKAALIQYFTALALDPEHTIVISQIGMSFSKQDEFSKAKQYFSLILEKTNNNQECCDAWLNIACVYRFENQWNKAEEALNKAEAWVPNDEAVSDQRKQLHKSKFQPTVSLISKGQGLFETAKIDNQRIEDDMDAPSSFRPN